MQNVFKGYAGKKKNLWFVVKGLFAGSYTSVFNTNCIAMFPEELDLLYESGSHIIAVDIKVGI